MQARSQKSAMGGVAGDLGADSPTARGNWQRWSRGHKARGQGQGHQKHPRPRTGLSKTDPLEAKDKGHKISKLLSANFIYFLNALVFKILDFVKFLMII